MRLNICDNPVAINILMARKRGYGVFIIPDIYIEVYYESIRLPDVPDDRENNSLTNSPNYGTTSAKFSR